MHAIDRHATARTLTLTRRACRHLQWQVWPEVVTTACGGGTRKLRVMRDDAGAIILRSTHPASFPQVRAAGEHCTYLCSQCGGKVYVPEDGSMTRQQCVQLAGGRNHTRTCSTRRVKFGVPSGSKKRGRAAPAEPSRKAARTGPKHAKPTHQPTPSQQPMQPGPFVVPASTVARFAALTPEARTQLIQRVVDATDGPDVWRPAICHQRVVLTRAGITCPAAYGRCLDACRAWALLDSSVTLRTEWRAAPDAVRACAARGCKRGCKSELFHAFVVGSGGERLDPTAAQLPLYGTATSEEAGPAVEPTGMARIERVRVGDGREQRIAKADLLTLRAVCRAVMNEGCITDPAAITPIQALGDRIWVKRDDLFSCNGARGSKARSVLRLAEDARRRGVGLVTGASRDSTMVGRLARVCQHAGVDCRIHVGRSNVLSVEEQDAVSHDAQLVKHADVAYLQRMLERADRDAAESGWTLVPFGVDCETHAAEIRRQVVDIPADCRRVVMAVGSGMAIAAVLAGLADCGRGDMPVLGVRVSDKPVDALLDRRAPADWRERVTFVAPTSKYETPATVTIWRSIHLDAFYEAKAAQFVREGDLFWLIACRAT